MRNNKKNSCYFFLSVEIQESEYKKKKNGNPINTNKEGSQLTSTRGM